MHFNMLFQKYFLNSPINTRNIFFEKKLEKTEKSAKIHTIYIAIFIANKKGLTAVVVVSPYNSLINMSLFEREKGIEPSTLSLGS